MAAREATLAASEQGCAHRTRVQRQRGPRSVCGRTCRQTQRPPSACHSWNARAVELRGRFAADPIPIARHRLRGRFSPTGSFAYRTRDGISSSITVGTPRAPGKRLSAHHTAMHLLQSGVDISVIALWLGHESPTTTHQYVEADLAMKEKALARLQDPQTPIRRYAASGRRTRCWSSSRRCDYVQNPVADSTPITRKNRRPASPSCS